MPLSSEDIAKLSDDSIERLTKQKVAAFGPEEHATLESSEYIHEPNPSLDSAYQEAPPPAINTDDEELWPGGIRESDLAILKKQNPNRDIYVTKVLERYFVIRTLTRLEYKMLVAVPNSNAIQREEMICETCVLYPSWSWQEMTEDLAGMPSTIASIIMQKSGFTEDYIISPLM